jgi:hypothetical protein
VPSTVRLITATGPAVGHGHLARTLALAEARWPAGVDRELALVSGAPSPAESARALAAGLRLVDHQAAPATGAAIVVDVPDPNSVAATVEAERLVIFDDRDVFAGEAAVVVQPSLPTWSGHATAGRVLAGYGWAPIGAAWRPWTERSPIAPGGDTPHVLVCFGGSDPHDVTGRIAPVIEADDRWRTTIVVGPDYEGASATGASIVRDPGDLPRRVAEADLVVLGGGTMKFEVAALGRPAILLAASDDQLPVGPPFASTGAALWLGDGRTIEPEAGRDAVARLLADDARRAAMSAAGRRVVDGAGADRLAAEIAALAEGQMSAS